MRQNPYKPSAHATRPATQEPQPDDPNSGAYWKDQVNRVIQYDVTGTVNKAEATQLFAEKEMNANWRLNFVSLQNWWSKRKEEIRLAGMRR